MVEVRYPRTYRHLDKGKYTDYEIYIEVLIPTLFINSFLYFFLCNYDM